LRETLVRVKQACDLHTSTLAQTLALDVLGDAPFMHTHLDNARRAYATKAHALEDALRGFGDGPPARGGMFLWRRYAGVDADALLTAAVEADVAFVPGSAFAVERSWSDHARLSFATLDRDTLRAAAAVLRELAAPARRR
jgi:2-aminoadipate transaminase